jgi:hypothetical protein
VTDSITCPRCGMTSHNANDVRERYCGNCHLFHDDMLIDPDCRDGKCGSCVGGACEHLCHAG